MPATAANLRRITEDIWTTVLGIVPVDAEATMPPGQKVLTGLVSLTGEWEGAVAIAMPEPLARLAAATMFAMGEDEVSDDDVRDTIGELANMTGGNVKSMLGGSTQLSLPTVTEGVDYQVTVRGTRVAERVELQCEGHPLTITTIQRQ